MASNLTPPSTQPNPSYRRPSLSSRTSTNDASTLTLSMSNHGEPYRPVPASPLLQQSRKESDARTSVYHSERDTPLTLRLGSGKPGAGLRYKRKTSRDMARSRESPVASEKRRTEKIEFLLRCEQEGGLTEALAEQQVAETELRNKQVTSPSTRKKAESALQNLRTQLRHQDVELYGKKSRI